MIPTNDMALFNFVFTLVTGSVLTQNDRGSVEVTNIWDNEKAARSFVRAFTGASGGRFLKRKLKPSHQIIVNRVKSGESVTQIAKDVGMCRQGIYQIYNRAIGRL